MANYANTKSIIAQNIYTNHAGQVTAEMVKTAANEIVNTLIAGGYLYAGVAKLTPTQTNPGSPDANVFYIATEPGTYTNFVGAGGSLVVADGEVAVLKWNGTWSKEVTGAATAAQVTELGQDVSALQEEIFSNTSYDETIEGNEEFNDFLPSCVIKKGATYKVWLTSPGTPTDLTPSSYQAWFQIVNKYDGGSDVIIQINKGAAFDTSIHTFTATEDGVLKVFSYASADIDIHCFEYNINNRIISLDNRIVSLEDNEKKYIPYISIQSNDISVDTTGSIFNYPTTSVLASKTINDNLEIVDATANEFVSEELSFDPSMAGLWQLIRENGAGVNSGFGLVFYSGGTAVKKLRVSNGEYYISVNKEWLENNSIDGVRLLGYGVQILDWTKLYLKRITRVYYVNDADKADRLEHAGVSLEYFPRESGETSDDGRFLRALKLCWWGRKIYVPAGTYIVNSPIHFNRCQQLTMGEGAVIMASSSFSADWEATSVIDYDCGNQFAPTSNGWGTNKTPITADGEDWNIQLGMIGGTIDANGKGDCLRLLGFQNFNLSEMRLQNPKKYGLITGDGNRPRNQYELMATKIFVNNLMGNNSGNVGFYIANTDNHLCDCVATDVTIGFQVKYSSCRLTRCHHWNGLANNGEYIDNSISFYIDAPDTMLTDCYADTSETNFKFTSNASLCRMIGCGSYSNTNVFVVPTCTHVYNDADYLALVGCILQAGVSPGGTLIPVAGNVSIWEQVASIGLN